MVCISNCFFLVLDGNTVSKHLAFEQFHGEVLCRLIALSVPSKRRNISELILLSTANPV